MTDKTYSTDELITDLRLAYEERICHPELQLQLAPVAEMINKRNAIIYKLRAADDYERKYAELVEVVSARTDNAKLRAADGLCEVAKVAVESLGHHVSTINIVNILRESIAIYEEAK
jgi:hypothetical protein